jgi:dCMP deaminase
MKFEIDEQVILNNNAIKGLPSNVGDLVIVKRYRERSQYDYDIELPSGDIVFVKESELTKLTGKQKQLITYIYKGNRVIYTLTNEEVMITQVDFNHNQVAIKFDDYGAIVVGVDALNKLDKEDNRKTWDQYFMDIATTVSTRATCERLHVGCVIVKDKKIVSTGYNGSVSGELHCDEIGHLYNEQGRCIRTIHAEQNAILFANREDLNGATAYVTHQPCENCAKLLVQSGVKRIVYKEKYTNTYSDFFMSIVNSVHLEV